MSNDKDGVKPMTASTAADFLNRGGWSKEEAILILNGLDPVANLHLFEDEKRSSHPMVSTYWFAVQRFRPTDRVLSVDVWLKWAITGTPDEPRQTALSFACELAEARKTGDFALLERRLRYTDLGRSPSEPWWVSKPDDPKPASPWYTPARYFARQFIKDDPRRAKKRKALAKLVAVELGDRAIYKRGSKVPPEASTIINSFSGVNLLA